MLKLLKVIFAAVVAAAKIDGGECRARLVLLDKEFTLKLNGFLAI